MKDGTENGWSRKRLVEIASISSGKSISAKDRAGKYSADNTIGRYFISTKDVGFDGNINHATDVTIPPEDQSSFKLAPKGSTLVCSEGGSAGRKVGLLKEDVHYGNKLFAVAGGDEVLPEMIHYFCLTDDFVKQFEDRKTGLIGGVSLSKFQTIEMPLPPLEEQQRIVAVLDEAFEGLARARENAEANLQNARELFESYIENAFAVSEDCSFVELDELAEIVSGYSFSSGDFNPENSVKSIKITNVGLKSFVETATANLPAEYLSEFSRFSIPAGSIVIALTRTIISGGLKVAIVPENFSGALLNQRVAALKVSDDDALRDYLYLFLSSSIVVKYVKEKANTLMQPNLSINDLKKLPVPKLDENRQKSLIEFSACLRDQVFALQEQYRSKFQELDDLRQSLLRKAFAGELT